MPPSSEDLPGMLSLTLGFPVHLQVLQQRSQGHAWVSFLQGLISQVKFAAVVEWELRRAKNLTGCRARTRGESTTSSPCKEEAKKHRMRWRSLCFPGLHGSQVPLTCFDKPLEVDGGGETSPTLLPKKQQLSAAFLPWGSQPR